MEKSKATLLLLIDLVSFIETRNTFELDELDVIESIELIDLLAIVVDHKEEFETLLLDGEENYQRKKLKLFVDIITKS